MLKPSRPQLGRYYLLLSLALALLFPTPSAAQTEMGLEELITLALEQNYQIKIFRNAERVADNANTIGNAGMLPTVVLNAEQRRAINNSRQQFFTGDSQQANNASRNSSSIGVEANWIIFDGLAMFARRERLEQLAVLSRADTRFLVEQTVADLAQAYYQLQRETELLKAFQQSLDVSQERVRFAEQTLAIGTGNELDLQLARVDRNTDSSLVVNQSILIGEVTLAINRLLNRELTAEIIPTDSLRLSTNLRLPELLESAQSNNAGVQQQRLAEMLAQTEIDILNGTRFPEVSLFGRYDYGRQVNEIGFLASSRTFGPEYGIRVRFNLFAGNRDKIARENAVILAETEQLRTSDVQLQVAQAVRAAHLRWSRSLERANLEQASLEAARAALEIAQRQLELSAITSLDFRIIQLNALNAETRFLEARFTAKNQEIELLRLSGKVLEG